MLSVFKQSNIIIKGDVGNMQMRQQLDKTIPKIYCGFILFVGTHICQDFIALGQQWNWMLNTVQTL